MKAANRRLPPYRASLAGTLLAAREAVMAPIRPYLREVGVTEQQWRILRVLQDEGACDPSGLAKSALLHPPSVTRILKELSDRRLVDRERNLLDGRRSMTRITPAGSELVASVARQTLTLLDAYRDRYGAERLAALQRDLSDLAVAIAPLGKGEEEEGDT